MKYNFTHIAIPQTTAKRYYALRLITGLKKGRLKQAKFLELLMDAFEDANPDIRDLRKIYNDTIASEDE